MHVKHALYLRLSDLSMRQKFLLQTVCVAIGIVALAVVAARLQYVDLNDTRQNALRAQTEMALGVVEQFAARVERGELAPEDARAGALDVLKAM